MCTISNKRMHDFLNTAYKSESKAEADTLKPHTQEARGMNVAGRDVSTCDLSAQTNTVSQSSFD